jgi:hypothetical protein
MSGTPRPTFDAGPTGRRRAALLGLLLLGVLAWLALGGLPGGGDGAAGLPAGRRLPAFAAPLATSRLVGDADVALPGGDRRAGRPACEVRGAGVLNSCALAARGPVVLAFLVAGDDRCADQVSRLDRLRAAHPAIRFAAVAIRGSRDALRRLVRARGWRLPVAWDRDGAVAAAYGVAVCPTVVYAHRGGRVAATALGSEDRVAVERRLAGL